MSNPEAGEETSESEENAPAKDAATTATEESQAVQAGESPESGENATAAEDGLEDAEDAEGDEEPLPPLVAVLEAALFASAEAVPLTRLTRVLGAWSRKQVSEALKELALRQEREGSGLRVVEAAGGFQLRSVRDFSPWVRKFFAERPPRLSRAVLETVAIIAYRQPATRGEIEAVRGVNCDAILGTLTARGLIQVLGRRESPGRPVEYGTTRQFLELFSIRDLSELPPLPDPSSLADLVQSAPEEGDSAEEPGTDATAAAEVDAPEQEPEREQEPEPEQEPEQEQGADLSAVGDAAPSGASELSDVRSNDPQPVSQPGDAEEDDGARQRAAAEDPEPGGDRFPEIGGSVDSGGSSPGQRQGGSGIGGQG